MHLREWSNYDPWREMERIQHDMNRIFNRAWCAERGIFPTVNIWTNPESVVVTAELPGYEPADIQLSVERDLLKMHGKGGQAGSQEGNHYHRRERGCGEFERAIRLPYGVEANKVEAKFTNGILSITLPRAEAEKPKKIQIKTV